MKKEDLMSQDAPLSARLGVFGTIDTAVFKVETAVVVVAMIAMSVAVFADVVFQFVSRLMQSAAAGESSWMIWTVLVVGFVAMMVWSATGAAALRAELAREALDAEQAKAVPVIERPSLAFRAGITLAAIGLCLGLGLSMLHVESSTVYRLVTAGLLFAAGKVLYDRGDRAQLAALVAAGLVVIWALGGLPGGYSWAQSYGLFLLLWVSFLGASIAARQRRHLRVDLTRKLLAPRWLPHFNALSYLVAAAFTALVFYLGFIYLFGEDSAYLRPIWEAPGWMPTAWQESLRTFPLPDDAGFIRRIAQVVFGPSEPGEVPDWLKVLSIPTAMALIVIRFVGHAVVFGRMALRGESFSETTAVH
ncbi:MAG: TRAP transporter small permease [Bradymonadaceae bacterium]|nr:TRAP transporter small permease [Lujinxingiaceae bacterium]